jgi:hypothetical protein
MSATRSLKRWSIAIAVAGVVTGGTAGLTAQDTKQGCSCTISGGGSYSCSTTSACGAGSYTCSVYCG